MSVLILIEWGVPNHQRTGRDVCKM